MTDSKARLDRRMLVAGLGSTAVALPAAAALPADADRELLALERRLGLALRLRGEAEAACSAALQNYLAQCREQPSRVERLPRTVAMAAGGDAGLDGLRAAWAVADAGLRRRTGCDALAARAAALAAAAEALTAAILARPAATRAGLAAKARLAELTGDARFARSVVDDLLRVAAPLNGA